MTTRSGLEQAIAESIAKGINGRKMSARMCPSNILLATRAAVLSAQPPAECEREAATRVRADTPCMSWEIGTDMKSLPSWVQMTLDLPSGRVESIWYRDGDTCEEREEYDRIVAYLAQNLPTLLWGEGEDYEGEPVRPWPEEECDEESSDDDSCDQSSDNDLESFRTILKSCCIEIGWRENKPCPRSGEIVPHVFLMSDSGPVSVGMAIGRFKAKGGGNIVVHYSGHVTVIRGVNSWTEQA